MEKLQSSERIKAACQMLLAEFGDQVSFPDQTPYNDGLAGYWSAQQAETLPACFFRPKSAREVARVISICRSTNTSFAVKSGGHTPFSGASNVANGITVDLAELNQISISSDQKTVSIGTGNKGLNVYKLLDPLDLTVVGGRVAGVGVGGLTLGGGISFLSNKYGWSCDNVVNFEVVTAAGEIINANQNSNPDLFWALRGGGNNFGIVTSFEVMLYPQGMMWGGDRYYPIVHSTPIIHNLVHFGLEGVHDDPKTCLIVGFAFQKDFGHFASVSVAYAEALDEGKHPAVFDGFFDIPDQWNNCANKCHSELTTELETLSNVGAMRQSFWTLTTYLDEDLTQDIVNIFIEESSKITHAKDILPGIGLQVITLPMLKHMSWAGGNCLGLENETRPLLLVNPSVRWAEAADDELVLQTYAKIVSRSIEAAKARSLYHPYVYMNYASQFQDPITSYGEANRDRLLEVAEKYDSDGVFHRLQPGHFKLRKA